MALGEIDPFEYRLARDLGRTLGELRHAIGHDEYIAWRAYYTWEAAMLDFEARKARARA